MKLHFPREGRKTVLLCKKLNLANMGSRIRDSNCPWKSQDGNILMLEKSVFKLMLYDQKKSCHPRNWCSYPKVLINPFVDPSAYREQMSPICRKLDILSDMSFLKILDKVKYTTLLEGKKCSEGKKVTESWLSTMLQSAPLKSQI